MKKVLIAFIMVFAAVFGLTACDQASSTSSKTTETVQSTSSQKSSSASSTQSSNVSAVQKAVDAYLLPKIDKNLKVIGDFTVNGSLSVADQSVKITWTSNSPAAVIGEVGEDGMVPVTVVRQDSGDVDVTITMTVTVAGQTGTKTFKFRVLQTVQPISYDEFIAADTDAEVIVKGYVQAVGEDMSGKQSFYIAEEGSDKTVFIYQAPTTANLKAGDFVKIDGFKEVYYEAPQIVKSAVEILDGTKTVGPVPATDIAEVAANQFVTLSGYTFVNEEEIGGYPEFTLTKGEETLHVRISKYYNDVAGDFAKALIASVNSGDIVNVSGFKTIYKQENMLYLLTSNAFEVTDTDPDMTLASDAAYAVENPFEAFYSTAPQTSIVLPLSADVDGTAVNLTWTSDNDALAIAEDGTVTMTIPSEGTTPVTVTVKATVNGKSVSRDFSVSLGITVFTSYDELAAAADGTVCKVQGTVIEIDSYNNPFIILNEGDENKVQGFKIVVGDDVKVGAVIALVGTKATFKEQLEITDGSYKLITAAPTDTDQDAVDAAAKALANPFQDTVYLEDTTLSLPSAQGDASIAWSFKYDNNSLLVLTGDSLAITMLPAPGVGQQRATAIATLTINGKTATAEFTVIVGPTPAVTYEQISNDETVAKYMYVEVSGTVVSVDGASYKIQVGDTEGNNFLCYKGMDNYSGDIAITKGAEVKVVGRKTYFNDVLQLDYCTTVVTKEGEVVPTPTPTPTIEYKDAADLFISEYYEGASSDKYVIITNATGAAIDLTDYKVLLYSNGATTPSDKNTLDLEGTLQNGESFLVYNKDMNADLLAQLKARVTLSKDSTVTYFNGDDVVTLVKGGAVIDIIGEIGVAPADKPFGEVIMVRLAAPNAVVTAYAASEWNITASH